jgi:hypothetical protein
MGKYVNQVMKRFEERRDSIRNNPAPTEKDVRCLDIVERFLASPRAFATAEPLMIISVLKFLLYSDKEINDLYFHLTFEHLTESEYKYVDPDSFSDES